MQKNFSIWHNIKTYLHNEKPRVYFHEREVWFCNLGLNIGFEQDGQGNEYLRPVIVLKKFNHQIFWAIPLTRTAKEGKFYYRFYFEPNGLNTALVSQIRLIDAKRLKYRIGSVNMNDFDQIKQKLKHLLE